ncbi:hypothetical protein NMY22_g19690 [Coprinellus aureogranulatus]|nr:hypothetical protein NMY22_g19690 [Coprinellus aureogranulatus]
MSPTALHRPHQSPSASGVLNSEKTALPPHPYLTKTDAAISSNEHAFPKADVYASTYSLKDSLAAFRQEAQEAGVLVEWSHPEDLGVFVFAPKEVPKGHTLKFPYLNRQGRVEPVPPRNWRIHHRSGKGEVLGKHGSAVCEVKKSGSNRRRTGKKTRGGVKHAGNKDDPQGSHARSLLQHHLRNAEIQASPVFSIVEHGSPTSTAWAGRPPPPIARKQIVKEWLSGELEAKMKDFELMPYSLEHPRPLIVVDAEGRTVLARTTQLPWLSEGGEKLGHAIHEFIGKTLCSEKERLRAAKGSRGPHFGCIIGDCRNYSKEPNRTIFHTRHLEEVEKFLATPIVATTLTTLSGLVPTYFPGVGDRYRASCEWHARQYNFKPLFAARDALRPHQEKLAVHLGGRHMHRDTSLGCRPLPLVSLLPLQCGYRRPVTSVASLAFQKLNLSEIDMKIITTNGDKPQQGVEYDDCHGRGSIVLFNQATMFQSSETGHATAGDARKAGVEVDLNFVDQLDGGFPRDPMHILRSEDPAPTDQPQVLNEVKLQQERVKAEQAKKESDLAQKERDELEEESAQLLRGKLRMAMSHPPHRQCNCVVKDWTELNEEIKFLRMAPSSEVYVHSSPPTHKLDCAQLNFAAIRKGDSLLCTPLPQFDNSVLQTEKPTFFKPLPGVGEEDEDEEDDDEDDEDDETSAEESDPEPSEKQAIEYRVKYLPAKVDPSEVGCASPYHPYSCQ